MGNRCPYVYKNGKTCNKEIAKDKDGNSTGFCNLHKKNVSIAVAENKSIEEAKKILSGVSLKKSSFSEDAWKKINYYEKYHEVDRSTLDDLSDVIIFMQGHLNYIFENISEERLVNSGRWLNEAITRLADVKEKFAYIKWNKENLICASDLKEFLVTLWSVLSREIQDRELLERVYKAMRVFMVEKFSERKGFNV